MNYAAYKNSGGTEKSDWIAGWVAVAGYLLLLILMVLFVTFGASSDFEKKEISSGVLINFGNNSPGSGSVITREESATKNVPKQTAEVKEPIVDDDAKDAVVKAVPKKPKEVKKKEPTPKPEPKQPEVNKGALYKKSTGGTSNSNKSSSHGSTAGRDGKSGSPDGELGKAGGGGTGGNFSLSGRSLLGALAKPDYDERVEGQIVIEIQVDRNGRVTAATFLPKSSTISSRKIIEAVRQAAMKTKFNADQSAAFTQVGTITYILKVE